jgi:hypothetical protein
LTGSTGPTPVTVVLGGTPHWYLQLVISEIHSIQLIIIGAKNCNSLFYYTRYILSTISSNLRNQVGGGQGGVMSVANSSWLPS